MAEKTQFSYDLNKNIEYIKNALSNCCDLKFRHIKLNNGHGADACAFYIEGMVDNAYVSDNVLRPIMQAAENDRLKKNLIDKIYNELVYVGNVKTETDPNSLIMQVITGSIGILIENESTALAVEAKGYEKRPVEEPTSETVVKGMRAGFVESIRTNTALIRRIVKSPKLKIESLFLGRITNTEINVAYIEGLVMDGLVEEIKKRLKRIDADGILSTGILQEHIEDSVLSVFSLSYSTERPDRACSCLLEGRALILVDNSPFVIIVPVTITHYLQSAEDYSTKYLAASITRLLRLVAINLNLLLPAIYVAIFSFHQEMIPKNLLKTVSEARERLPFPIFFEMLLLESAFDILREAGIRLPRPIGQAVSIVGALVIGQAAVAARLVSPPSIIVVALTAICSFTIPVTEAANTYRVLRYPILFAAGAFGMPGIVSAAIIIIIHASGLRSFGVPFFSPVSPFSLSDWKDFVIRVPARYMKTRPVQTGKADLVRQSSRRKTKNE